MTPRPHSATAVPTPSRVPPGEAGFSAGRAARPAPTLLCVGTGPAGWPCCLRGWRGALSTDCSHCGPGARLQGIALPPRAGPDLCPTSALPSSHAVASWPVHIYLEEPIVSPRLWLRTLGWELASGPGRAVQEADPECPAVRLCPGPAPAAPCPPWRGRTQLPPARGSLRARRFQAKLKTHTQPPPREDPGRRTGVGRPAHQRRPQQGGRGAHLCK